MKNELPIATIFDIPVVTASKNEVLSALVNAVEVGEFKLIFTPNPEQITLSFHDANFKKLLQSADVNLPDGQGIIWALKRQWRMENGKWKIKNKGKFSILPASPRLRGAGNSQFSIQRLAGREVFHDLLQASGEKGWRVFLLGGKPGSVEKIKWRMENGEWKIKNDKKFSIDYDPGAKNISRETSDERERVLQKIKEFKPHIIFVAYGAPWQEKWLVANKEELSKSGVKLAMVVGGAFDYEAGLVPKVPEIMEKLKLEWLWRLLREPWRWKRQLKGLEFFWRVIFSSKPRHP